MTTNLVGSSVKDCDASVLPSASVTGVPVVGAEEKMSSSATASVVGGSSSVFILPRIFTRTTVKRDITAMVMESSINRPYNNQDNCSHVRLANWLFSVRAVSSR